VVSSEEREEIERELEKARQARENGYEGMARVCARRAAGIAVRAFYESRGIVLRGSAYDLLKYLAADMETSPGARQAAEFLVLRVDEEFKLPEGVDLLTEAQMLVSVLQYN
jgi:HEPN domain-containing protein